MTETKKTVPWTDTILYQRPEEEFISVKRELVADAKCPACDSKDVRRYPIVNWMGARIVTKCQACFHVLEIRETVREDKWPPYWPVTHDWAVSLAEQGLRSKDGSK